MIDLLQLTVSLYGLAIVISFLVAGLIRLIVVVQERYRPPEPAKPRVPARPAAPPPQTGVPAAHIAAISAALAALVGSHRIVHVQAMHGRGWSAEGRTQHHTSHNLPRRPHR